MKVEAVQSQNSFNNKTASYKSQRVHANNVSFKGLGISDALVQIFDAISRGGLAASFLVQDVTSCGVPRTIVSINRNKEEIGDLNYPAAFETGAREALTGSSMFIIPALVLAAFSKITGTAAKVPVRTINDFSDIMKEVKENKSCDKLRKEFYTKVFTRLADNNEIKRSDIPYFVESTILGEKAKSRGFINNILDKASTIKSKEEWRNEIAENFAKQKKSLNADFKTEFTSATLTKNAKTANGHINTIDIENLLKSLKCYTDDYIKNGMKVGIDKFKVRRIGSRFAANVLLTAGVGAFLIILPRLYSISETNPEAVIKKGPDTFEKGGSR